MIRFRHGLLVLASAVSIVAVAACGGDGSSSSTATSGTSGGTTTTSSSNSEVALGVAAGASGSDDTGSGVALNTRSSLRWIVDQLAFERVAYAAAWSCGTGTWTGGGTASQTWAPPGCTITYGNGSTSTLTWLGGPWDLTFSTSPSCTPTHSGLVGSGCAINSTVTWSTPSGSSIERKWTGPLGNSYDVTMDAGSNGTSGWTTSVHAVGTLVTCTTSCPAVNSASGTRTFNIGQNTTATPTGGINITGGLDGVTTWNHTVYTPYNAPLTITGSGANRVIVSGTIVVEHNLAHKVFTTVFNGPLTHQSNCAFPVSGSVTTTVQSSGSDNGKSETVSFSSTCGEATLTGTDGSVKTLLLSMVL